MQQAARQSAGTLALSTHMIIERDVLAAYIYVYVFRWHSACSHIDWELWYRNGCQGIFSLDGQLA